MKKVLLLFAFLCGLSINSYAQNGGLVNLEFSVEIIKGIGIGNPFPKSPVLPPEAPEATQEGNVLTFTSTHDDYTLTLLDEDGEVAYQAVVPSTVNVVVLPTTLSGEFELQLDYGGNFYFYCEIEL